MNPRRSRWTAVLVAITALVLPVGLITTAPSQAAPAAAPYVPDSLFPEVGNPGYDVSHYAIALRYRPDTKAIDATTTISAWTWTTLAQFTLDLEGLTVGSVEVNGRPAAYQRAGNKLTVIPQRPVRGRFVTVVHYAGVPTTHIDPDGAQDGWVPHADGGATALNEPVGAMTWFPNNNTPRDKATFDIAITVPSGLEAAANGLLVSQRTADGLTTWRWRQRQPQATYLAMVSIADYRVYRSSMKLRSGRTIPIWSFIDPALGSLADQRKRIPEIIRFQEQQYGRYPFDSAGIVVKEIGVGYALETQDRPFFDGTPDTGLLVHEFAHQWYGNSVTPKDWGDIWLNEGFASYAEDVWSAAHGGGSTAAAFQQRYDSNPDDSDLWTPAPADLTDPADLFSDPVYTRGGMALEALRQEVGSADFDAILREWATRYRDRTVSTAQFIALSEHISGEELDAFFEVWLYTAERPQGY